MLSKKIRNLALVALAFGGLAVNSAMAQTAPSFPFAAGDLIMGFQDTATGTVLQIDLGATQAYRNNGVNGTAPFLIGNIGSLLSTAFGASWADTTTVFFGAAGSRSSSSLDNSGTNTGAGSAADPNRTVYFTKQRLNDAGYGAVGSGNSGTFTGSTAAANFMVGMANTYSANGSAVGFWNTTAGVSNNWASFNAVIGGIQSPAFGANISGGAQQALTLGALPDFAGYTNVQGVLDLWRNAQFVNGSATPNFTANTPYYVGSIVLDGSGNLYFAVPEPSTYAMLAAAGVALAVYIRRRQTASV